MKFAKTTRRKGVHAMPKPKSLSKTIAAPKMPKLPKLPKMPKMKSRY